jgi:RNA methyltransferase, TrmH family
VAEERAPDSALVDRLARGGPVHVVADRLMAELGTLGHPARVIGVFRRDDLPQRTAEATLGVHLHRVIDPGNVGTIVRAAGALGPAFVSLSAGCSDPLSGKGVRASMGAVFRVPIEHSSEAPPDGMPRIALAAGGGVPLWELDLAGPVLFLVGAERLGLPDELVESADHVAHIPQAPDAESLNAAAAATVALYEAVRQRA